MSISLSASVAIPGIPRFYKSNVQGSNKSISVIPNFYPPGWENTKQGLYIAQTERSGQSEVEYSLLGVKREEGKSILLENVFIYGVDPNLWSAANTFIATNNFYADNYCSILNSARTFPVVAIRTSANPSGYLIRNKRLQNVLFLANSQDLVFDPSTRVKSTLNSTVPASTPTTFTQPYVAPTIYHDGRRSCVTMEGWLEPYITPWWRDFPGEFCAGSILLSPFTSTLTLETNKTFRYEPGKAMVYTMGIKADLTGGVGYNNGNVVNSRASWGARNDTDSYRFVLEGNGDFYVERLTPYAETSLRTYRKDFLDPLDGTGASGLTIDFSKVTMYSIEFSWYGAIGANFYVYVPIKKGEAKWVKIATLLSSNRYTKPALSNPNMRLFTELFIPMGCKNMQSLSLFGSSVYIDGEFRDTLKYYTVSTQGMPVEQRTKTFVTLEVPNFLEGLANKPRNNSNVYPYILNGITTVDSQIDIYESTGGGSPDILTAYRTSSLPESTSDEMLLLSNITMADTRSFVVCAFGMTENEKIDFMRRAVNGFLTITNPVTTYEPNFINAGGQRFFGTNNSYELQITSLSSRVNDPRINIVLDNPLYPPFPYYYSTNTANIALRNQLATQYSVISTYPSIPSGAILYSPAMMPPGKAKLTFDTNVKNNRSFLVTRIPIKSGTYSFDTDINVQEYFFAAYGIISRKEYDNFKANDNYLTELKTNLTTNVQIVSTSPANQLLTRGEFYFTYYRGQGSYIPSWPPNAAGYPQLQPFWNGSDWVTSELPIQKGNWMGSRTMVPIPGIPSVESKQEMGTLLDSSTFTVNLDVRDHTFYLYGITPQLTIGPDMAKYTYIRVKLRPSDLYSLEEGIVTNNFYNFKLLVYGHNGNMMNCLVGRSITSPLTNWTEASATIQSMVFGDGTIYEMNDGAMEVDGSLYYTIAFPKSNVAAVNAFLQKPNIQIKFKTVFLRNTAYRSPTSVLYKERNAGLWYGTLFLNTTDPVHLFILLQSKTTIPNNYAQQIMQSATTIPRPMVTNIQLYNGRDENDVILGETPFLDSANTTLVTQITSTTQGVVNDLPVSNYNFIKIPGINTLYDTSTSQLLNNLNKVRRFTFTVNKNIPFTYDLSTVYGNNRYVLAQESTSILNRDFKRLFITAKTTFDESFGSPWEFSVNKWGGTRVPFSVLNPFGITDDAPKFTIDTLNTNKNVYLKKVLKTPAISDAYYIWSVYAKSLTPALSAGRFIVFELKTGESNAASRWQPVFFDIIDNRIGFYNGGTKNINGSIFNWQNNYDKMVKGTLTANDSLCANTNWFPATASRPSYSNIKGYANLANKTNGRYVVAAHIEDVGGGWKRISACTYFNNNHTDNVIYIGNYTSTFSTSGNVSLWGFQEEIVSNTSNVDVLSSWYPSTYVPIGTGVATFNLTIGEQQ